MELASETAAEPEPSELEVPMSTRGEEFTTSSLNSWEPESSKGKRNFNELVLNPHVSLLDDTNARSVAKWEEQLRGRSSTFREEEFKSLITERLKAVVKAYYEGTPEEFEWADCTFEGFLRRLRNMMQFPEGHSLSYGTLEDQLRLITLRRGRSGVEEAIDYGKDFLEKIVLWQKAKQVLEFDADEHQQMIAVAKRTIVRSNWGTQLLNMVTDGGAPTTITGFIGKFMRSATLLRDRNIAFAAQAQVSVDKLTDWLSTQAGGAKRTPEGRSKGLPRGGSHNGGQRADTAYEHRQNRGLNSPSVVKCWGCGRTGHRRDSCTLRAHPDFNHEMKAWAESAIGKQWAAKGRPTLPKRMDLVVAKYTDNPPPAGELSALRTRGSRAPVYMWRMVRLQNSECDVTLRVLLDSGAIPYSILSHRFVQTDMNMERQPKVCTAYGQCECPVGNVTLALRVESETIVLLNVLVTRNLTEYDLVIGVDDLSRHEVLRQWLLASLTASPMKSISSETSQVNLTHTKGNERIPVPKIVDHGPKEFQEELYVMLRKHQEVFSTELQEQPARVTPHRFDVRLEEWEVNSNRTMHRPQSIPREAEINVQVAELLKANVIKPCLAAEHSQVLLVEKKDGTRRFCVDYRRLNAATIPQSWPIPNIAAMLDRLGRQQAKYFAVIDLTKGYFQAPLHEECQKYTSFITSEGVYAFTRVPMGLRGAPAYFQKVMMTEVLPEILYKGCEVYLDDIIVFGRTERDFLVNLNIVLECLDRVDLKVNPHKCTMAVPEVEYVGHTITESGKHFSREKLDKVSMFPKPKRMKELKAFLGLINYFRDHVRGHSMLVRPLHAVLGHYKRSTRNQVIPWTPELEQVFEVCKEAVTNCPPLFFINGISPVHVYTDASEYGIGGYICQVIDNEERPIAFMSEALSGPQIQWSVIEKECFAIVRSLLKFEYLIRGVHFYLHTITGT